MKQYLPVLSLLLISNFSFAEEQGGSIESLDQTCVLKNTLVGPSSLYQCTTGENKVGNGTLHVDLTRIMIAESKPDIIYCQWDGTRVRSSGDGDIQNGYQMEIQSDSQAYKLIKIEDNPNVEFTYGLPFSPDGFMLTNVNHICYVDRDNS
ncbi:hypothetical protein [uncultured Vibrio sp.]|uniref:hypothetical protein n=1 Tax=uncultured Vibrio sp. TaxID=114054 RepID=UPI0026160D91|nr:hypothetical protein [uncultured Vibrio sp.]